MKISLRDFADADGVLATRENGERARHHIEHCIALLTTPSEVVALDLEDVKAVTVPFVEQCVGLLLSGRLAGYYEEHPFVLLNSNEDVRETIDAVLRLRHLSALSISNGRIDLLGGEQALKETMEAATQLIEFTVSDLVRELHVSAQAVNNRLRQLVQSGALARRRVSPERGGREFRYVVPLAKEEQRSSKQTTQTERSGSRRRVPA